MFDNERRKGKLISLDRQG